MARGAPKGREEHEGDMKVVALGKARDALSACIDEAQEERILITRHGRPVALIVGVEGEEFEDLMARSDQRVLADDRIAPEELPDHSGGGDAAAAGHDKGSAPASQALTPAVGHGVLAPVGHLLRERVDQRLDPERRG